MVISILIHIIDKQLKEYEQAPEGQAKSFSELDFQANKGPSSPVGFIAALFPLFEHYQPIRSYTLYQVSILIDKLAQLEFKQDQKQTFLAQPLIKSGIYHIYEMNQIEMKKSMVKIEHFWKHFLNKKKS